MDIIRRYFPKLEDWQYQKLEQLQSLYADWNSKINLISRNDITELYERHVLHSLAIAKFFPFKPGTKIIDIGTGGGFPGIPLAIVFPEVQFTLVDSIQKKIKVVQDVIEQLKLKNATAACARVETLNTTFDFAVTRAVAEFPLLINWMDKKIKKQSINDFPNGIIALKGGNLAEELKFIPQARTYNIEDIFLSSFFIEKKIVFFPYFSKSLE
jgi:16S rRNA (guanine527-N7)-methyltransferase